MSHGRPARHTILVLACVILIAGSTGCRRSLFERLADDAAPATALNSDRSEIPQLLPVPDNQIQPAKADVLVRVQGSGKADPTVRQANAADQEAPAPVAPKPTPLLDAALKRAIAEEERGRQALRPLVPQAALAVVTVNQPKTPEKPKPALPPQPAPPPQARKEASPPSKETDGLVPAPPGDAQPTDEPEDPQMSWEESVDRLKKLAQESASQSASNEGAALWQVRAKVMDWMASENSKDSREALLKQAVVTIADAMNTKGQGAAARTDQLRLAVLELEDRVPLGITNLRVCRNVLGFGSFEPIEPSRLKAGQPVILYCELTGLHYQNSGPGFVSRLSSRVELIDARSSGKVWEQSLGEAEDHCQSRRRDNYVNFRMKLPQSIKPGDYRLRLTQTDMVANQTASAELPVTIIP
jgi:hypothetical protein